MAHEQENTHTSDHPYSAPTLNKQDYPYTPDEPAKHGTSSRYDDSNKYHASSKIWSSYISEADRYDRAMVESWKGDMDGILIFVSMD